LKWLQWLLVRCARAAAVFEFQQRLRMAGKVERWSEQIFACPPDLRLANHSWRKLVWLLEQRRRRFCGLGIKTWRQSSG
jgi:hypothetical protein